MRNEFYFQIKVTQEQVNFTNTLVEFSMKHHKVANIWDKSPKKKEKTREYRFTGSLGEVVFADVYQLERPQRSFGAYDGQDLGKDFQLVINGKTKIFDIKSMQRKSNVFYDNYVLNISASQLHKPNSLTEYYFCISFHKEKNIYVASFLGYINKNEIEQGKVGVFYKMGTVRTRGDGSEFPFNDDTYEIDFEDITTPIITEQIKQLNGFEILKVKS